jgi:ABC-type molybdate transport system substrate-binding protein
MRTSPPLAVPGLHHRAQAGEVQVAVAANFAGPIAKIGEAFTAATGHVLKVSTGSTGKFYTQIVSGAPFEVLVAADDETPKKLIAENHAVAGTQFTYAIGKLVLWSAQAGSWSTPGRRADVRQGQARGHRQPQGGALWRGGA